VAEHQVGRVEPPLQTTVVIKTFERPAAVDRLITSIRTRYPAVPVVIVDDSREVDRALLARAAHEPATRYVHLGFDVGVSAGRNHGVRLANTRYVFNCDDDCFFGPDTDLRRAEELLEATRVDILGINDSTGFWGLYSSSDGVVECQRASRGEVGAVRLVDFAPSQLLAPASVLRRYPWDETLKVGEHFAYFYAHLGKIRVGYTEAVSIHHEPMSSPLYDSYRGRALDYVRDFMRRQNLRRRVDLAGEVLEI
jgi:glycosyltransferase involved in cell wall biosynthesis